MGEPKKRRTPLIVATAAAAGYGAWAFLCNYTYGLLVGVRAGLVQAALSFTSTFLLAKTVEQIFRLGRSPRQGLLFCVILAPLVVFGLLYGIHAANRTPRILATIAPSTLIGSIFLISYAFSIYVSATRTTANKP